MKRESIKKAVLYVVAVLLCQCVDSGIDWAVPLVLELIRQQPAAEVAPSATTASERSLIKCPMLGADVGGIAQAKEPR